MIKKEMKEEDMRDDIEGVEEKRWLSDKKTKEPREW